MSVYKKPRWAPNAVATDKGWVDPETGELLVSLKNLKSKIAAESKTQETKQKAKDDGPKIKPVKEEEAKPEKPKRKRRGRPRKTK